MYMIFYVLNDPERLDDMLDAWTKAGIKGITFIESTGYARRHHRLNPVPMRYVFNNMMPDLEQGQYVLMSLVDAWEDVESCLKATEGLVGSLDEPNSGVFAAWPLALVRGLDKPYNRSAGDM
jgi:nitrogen regulatory protein P-II 1